MFSHTYNRLNMNRRTFQIQYNCPERGLQLGFEVAANAEAAKKKFSGRHKKVTVLTCTPTTKGYGDLKP